MKRYLYFIAVLSLLWGCKDDEGWDAMPSSEIATLQAKDIFFDNAVIQGRYTPLSREVSGQGFMLSEEPITELNPGRQYAMDAVTSGIFRLRVKDLQRKTWYYVKAYIDRPSGERVFGGEIRFMTDSIVILPPGKPVGTIVALDGRTVSVEAQATTLGNEALTADEKKIAEVGLADCGIYYWPENDTEANARFFSIGEDVASSYAASARISYSLEDLEPGTAYSYRLSIRMQVSFNSGKWRAYGEEVKSDAGLFRTADLELPAATTLDPSDITPTSVTAYGMLDDKGNDPLVEYGIEYGPDAEHLEHKVFADNLSQGTIQTFSLFIQDLAPETTYYYRAFAENDAGYAVSSVVKSFTTDAPGLPVVDDYPFAYDFRVGHFTTHSVWLRVKMLSDGGDPLVSKGFYWGTTPEAVTHKIEVPEEVTFDGSFYSYAAEISSVEGPVVYYKPYAVNGKGEYVSEEIFEVRTAVSGGKLYCFDSTKGLTPTYNNMVESSTELVYYELDLIRTSSAVYYMLDRNLGATRPYDLTFYDKSFAQAAQYPMLFDAAGYYYQFDRPIPSTTPDMKITAVMDAAPYYWTRTASYFTDPEMNARGATWDQPVCPPGYDLPTQAEITDIIEALQPVEADRTLPNLFQAARFGVTGSRTSANGNLLNNTDPTASEIWLKGPHPTNKDEAKIMRIATPPMGTVTYPNSNRYFGRPVRCIRKEAIN